MPTVPLTSNSSLWMSHPRQLSCRPGRHNSLRLSEALRPLAIPPGDYMVPRPSTREDMRSPEFLDKLNKGPVMMVTVMPNGMMSMGRNFVLWFLFSLVVSAFAACVAASALSPGAPFRGAFHFTAITAFLGYAVALWPMSIWYRRAWSLTLKATVDGLIYAVLTGFVFGWLWPR